MLDFEQEILQIEGQVKELESRILNPKEERVLQKLKKNWLKAVQKIYNNLTQYQKLMISRHPKRPSLEDYIDHICQDFFVLSGDRVFGEDKSLKGGLAKIDGHNCILMGTVKGHDRDSRLAHNFGMLMPEGYRKAKRLMELAEHYQFPLVNLVNTPGAYPGVDAENRCQSQAIALALATAVGLKTPIISVITGEAFSGGAIVFTTGDAVAMLEHSSYSVISPEACSSILWHNSSFADEVAQSLQISAQNCLRMKVIDKILPEFLGGAHRNQKAVMEEVKQFIVNSIEQLTSRPLPQVLASRQKRLLVNADI